MKKYLIPILLLAVLATTAGAEGSMLTTTDGPLSLALVAETGAVKVVTHTIQIGESSDVFDYVSEGGQDILFPFTRYTAEVSLLDQHTVIFLYQPLEIATQVRFDEARTIDGVTFDADEGVDIVYSFPFYRASYLYDFAASSNLELAAGLSLQLRNASIRWASVNGDQGDVVASQNLGPVPIIKVRAGYTFPEAQGAFVEFEADGFYASSAFINGADYAFEGSIFDASLRGGFEPAPGLEVFANLRGLGGGGKGTRPAANREFWSESRDGFTDNFLTTVSLTLGARVR
jgi:hypothetical protein